MNIKRWANPQRRRVRNIAAAGSSLLAAVFCSVSFPTPAQTNEIHSASDSLVLSRTVRPWEFLPVPGTRAALFGNEAGHFEAWAYPLKILRDFHLQFNVGGEVIPADSLARTVTVRPESCTILYSSAAFKVIETLFVPAQEPGAIISIAVESTEPLEIEAVFERDFTLEWPAALGGTYLRWEATLPGFSLEEEQNKFAAVVGSPSAVYGSQEYSTNYSSSRQNSFLLGPTKKGDDPKLIVIVGSTNGRKEAEDTYHRLVDTHAQLLVGSADYYSKYLSRTINLDLPDPVLQSAYDWSRVSMIQGMANNSFLGESLVGGYNQSGDGQRPGFAWFFGRDSLWTSLALDASGDFASTRTVLDFLAKYQRKDGKITHEVSQSATFVPWFEDYPYAFASADATPLYLIVMNDYVLHTGNVAYASEKWNNIARAVEFLHSTYDSQGLAQNAGVGHGWIEGGPLLPVKSELYQAGLAAEATRAGANLARLTGQVELHQKLADEFVNQQTLVNKTFWSPDVKSFVYAVDPAGKRLDISSVLSTVPMWFSLLDGNKAELTINRLADFDQQTDWGMRVISSRDQKYNPQGYHFGAVWPLFTGWASVGEYRYHRPLPAFSNLRANAQLTLDGSLGHVTEVLSGDYYAPTDGGTPDQIWSAAMVVAPLLTGLLGLDVDALANRLRFAPHIPAHWLSFKVKNVHIGSSVLELDYERSADEITLTVMREGQGDCAIDFEPAFSLRAKVVEATVNGRAVPANLLVNSEDQHLALHLPLQAGRNTIQIRVRQDFELSVHLIPPMTGASSEGLRVISQSWSATHDSLTLNIAGLPGANYDLPVLNASQISTVEGGKLVDSERGEKNLRISFPQSEEDSYQRRQVTIHFVKN